jgi:hypothetical protein
MTPSCSAPSYLQKRFKVVGRHDVPTMRVEGIVAAQNTHDFTTCIQTRTAAVPSYDSPAIYHKLFANPVISPDLGVLAHIPKQCVGLAVHNGTRLHDAFTTLIVPNKAYVLSHKRIARQLQVLDVWRQRLAFGDHQNAGIHVTGSHHNNLCSHVELDLSAAIFH